MPKTIAVNGSFDASLVKFRGDMMREFVERGHTVHATAPAISDGVRAALQDLGVQTHSLPLSRSGINPLKDLRYFLSLRALLLELKPSLVLNYTIKPNIWGSLAACSLAIPVASMVTGGGLTMIEEKGLKRRFIQGGARQLYRWALRSNFVTIFQNDDDAKDFVDLKLVKKSQVRQVSGSGVNLLQFIPSPLPRQPIFLMIARLLKTKGVREYAEAALSLKAELPEARFLLVGERDPSPDGIETELVDRMEEFGVQYLGGKDDVRPALAAASIYVLPSYREGTPRSVLEAMAVGRPIITTNVPGCKETVVSGQNGLLVNPRDVEDLRSAMLKLGRDADLRQKMGAASLEIVRKKYDVRTVNAALIRHLDL